MNIFVTDADPAIAAKNLDDKRVIKMIVESAQMLSTAMTKNGIGGAPYRSTHANHPCTLWAATSQQNFEWLLNHMVYLCCEYTLRYGKIHKSAQHMDLFRMNVQFFPDIGLTPFANCTPHKDQPDTIVAYRMTMIDKWANDKRTPTWKYNSKPTW
jgi:hypothetical protein